jgi:hypothetical protein
VNDPAMLVAVISIAACLVLAIRGFRSRQPGFNRTLIMGVIWAVIIAALASLLQHHTP